MRSPIARFLTASPLGRRMVANFLGYSRALQRFAQRDTRIVMNQRSNPSVTETSALALELHGAEYHGHLERVRGYFLELAALLPKGILAYQDIEDGEHATLLHDSIEDGYATREGLMSRGYIERVILIVLGLTRIPSKETYRDKMLATAATGDIVLIIAKLADNRDNSTPERIADLPEERRSLINRYRTARRILFDGLAAALRARGVPDETINEIERWLGNKDTAPW
jgi:(p)ppGpp synthase/HD superfamily hydrolase